MEVSLPRKLKFLEAFPEGPIISSAYSLITAGLVSNGPFEFICRPSLCSCFHSIFRLLSSFFLRNRDRCFDPTSILFSIDSKRKFSLRAGTFRHRAVRIARIIVPVSEVSRKGIPRSVQLSVSRRCIDDRRPPKYIKDSPNNERLNECCHLSRVFPRYDRVIDFQASKGNTRFFVYITLIKRLHSPRTYRDNINHAEHSNNLIFTRTRYKFISFILPFATSNPCSRVFTTHDCAIGNTILLQKRIEAFSQAERA